LRGIELAGFLSSTGSRLANPVFVDIPHYISFGIENIKINIISMTENFYHQLITVTGIIAEFSKVQILGLQIGGKVIGRISAQITLFN